MFYSADTSSFSPTVFTLDSLTLDVSVIWFIRELRAPYVPAKGFRGPVVEIVGEFDQLHCANDIDVACVASALQVSEKPYWPDSRDLRVVVRAGSGHDLNLDFGAAETFRLYSTLAQTLV